MAGLGSFFLEFGVDISTLQKGINNAETRLTSFAKKAEDIGTKLSVGVSLPLSIIGKNALQTSAQFESLEMSFGTMLRSMDKGKQLMQDLQKYNLATSFNFEEVAKAGKSMLAFGFAQQQIIPNLKMIGDISAGVGIKVDELAEIYGKAKVQGRLFAEDINQLTGRGIPIIAELAKQFGVSETAIKKMTEDGKIGFNNLEKAFESLTAKGGQFYNMTANQSTTMQGLYSNLEDSVTNNLRTIGDSLVKNLDLKTVIPQATQYLNDLTKKFTELSPEAQKAIVVIGGAATVLPPLLALAGTVLPAIQAGFLALVSPAGLAGTAIAGAAIYAITHWDSLSKRVTRFQTNLQKLMLDAGLAASYIQEAVDPSGASQMREKLYDAYGKGRVYDPQREQYKQEVKANYNANKIAMYLKGHKPKKELTEQEKLEKEMAEKMAKAKAELMTEQEIKAAEKIAKETLAIQERLLAETDKLNISFITDKYAREKKEAQRRYNDDVKEMQSSIQGKKGLEDEYIKYVSARYKALQIELTNIDKERYKPLESRLGNSMSILKEYFDRTTPENDKQSAIDKRMNSRLQYKIQTGTRDIQSEQNRGIVSGVLKMDIPIDQWTANANQYIQAAEAMKAANDRIKNSFGEISMAAAESMGITIANMLTGTATITNLANSMLQTVGNVFADMLRQLASAELKVMALKGILDPTSLIKTIGLAAGAGILAGLSNKIGQGKASNRGQQMQPQMATSKIRGGDIFVSQQRYELIKGF